MSDKRPELGAQELPTRAVSSGTMAHNQTGSWRYLYPVHENKLAPCFDVCPAGTDIPRFLALAAEGRFIEAYESIRETNPLPTICGHVCYHPCQAHCSRQMLDAGISVQAVERFVSEVALEGQPRSQSVASRSERVAIIGAGPAGLTCAHFLAQQGIQVTIFDSGAEPGGMLRAGIPAFRLPREILDKEIAEITRLGVQFRLNVEVGKDIRFETIAADFDAVFVSTGAHQSRALHLENEADASVMTGLAFLRQVNSGRTPQIGASAVVIGGGNTAIDTARVALRLGAETSLVYRRTLEQMPAHPAEIAEAEAEGVTFTFLAVPKALQRNGDMLEVTFQKMELGAPDSSGRPRPVPIPGSEFVLRTETVLVAVGEQPDLSFVPSPKSIPGVSVGGDAASGPSTVPEAIASGREAALSILSSFGMPIPITSSPRKPRQKFDPQTLNPAYFPSVPPIKPPALDLDSRRGNFREIIGSFDADRTIQEARRCLSCGVCNTCDNCWVFCPDSAISRTDGEYSIDLDYCKGCGICAHECPRGVISLKQEES